MDINSFNLNLENLKGVMAVNANNPFIQSALLLSSAYEKYSADSSLWSDEEYKTLDTLLSFTAIDLGFEYVDTKEILNSIESNDGVSKEPQAWRLGKHMVIDLHGNSPTVVGGFSLTHTHLEMYDPNLNKTFSLNVSRLSKNTILGLVYLLRLKAGVVVTEAGDYSVRSLHRPLQPVILGEVFNTYPYADERECLSEMLDFH